MRNWNRRANLGYAEARKQSKQEVMHLHEGNHEGMSVWRDSRGGAVCAQGETRGGMELTGL